MSAGPPDSTDKMGLSTFPDVANCDAEVDSGPLTSNAIRFIHHLLHPMNIRNAYYIKLGRGGCWEADSIANSRLRFGWRNQNLNDINLPNWVSIDLQLREEHIGKPQVATNDLNRLRDICQSTKEDIWITFHGAKLWWCRLADGSVGEDDISKFRRVQGNWSDTSIIQRLLVASELPGRIAQLQAFRGTVCRVWERELLARVIEGTKSDISNELSTQRTKLAESMERAIAHLHWKDYETLVDLVFRSVGWIRVSILGQQTKGYDLELREPITNDRYVVQVKSQADLTDLTATVAQFSEQDYRKVFFVVHTPAANLAACTNLPGHVELVPPSRLAELALDAGLSNWLASKVV